MSAKKNLYKGYTVYHIIIAIVTPAPKTPETESSCPSRTSWAKELDGCLAAHSFNLYYVRSSDHADLGDGIIMF